MPTIILSPLSNGLGPYVKEDLQTLRRRTGLLMGVLTYGTVLSATSTSFVLDAIKRYPDDYAKAVGGVAYVVSGTGAGQSRTVTGTTQATGTVTVSLAFSPVPDTTSVVEIWPASMEPQAVNNALNLSVIDAQELVFIPDRQNPQSIDTTYYRELALPAGFIYVYGFQYKDSGGLWRVHYPAMNSDDQPSGDGDRSFFLIGTTMVLKPTLSASINLSDMWVLGYRRPALLVNDTDVSDVRTDFLVYKAATLLEEANAGGGEVDPEDHAGRGTNWLREALDIRARMMTALEPNTLEVKP